MANAAAVTHVRDSIASGSTGSAIDVCAWTTAQPGGKGGHEAAALVAAGPTSKIHAADDTGKRANGHADVA